MFRSTSRNRRYESWLTALVIPFTLLILAESPLRLTTSGHINRTSPHSGVNGSLDSTSSRSEAATKARLEEAYGKLPLLFGANHGQTDARVKFLARSGAQTLFLTAGEAVLKLRRAKPGQHEPEPYFDSGRMTQRLSMTVVESDVLRMRFVNANPRARIFGVEPATSKSHYLIGNDPREWETNVANYSRVKYEGLYPGVDVVWYGAGRQIEYDLLVKPGARPDRVNLEFPGAGEMVLADDGALILRAGGGQEARLLKPRAWQDVDGERREIDCGYRIEKNRRVAFRIGAHDTRLTLVIDPVLSYSTYLGGLGFDAAYGVAVDGEGNAYVTGATDSADFPGPSQIQQTRGASSDVFVAKLDPTGRALVWGTWLGGGGQDLGTGVAVDVDATLGVRVGVSDNPLSLGVGVGVSPGVGLSVGVGALGTVGTGGSVGPSGATVSAPGKPASGTTPGAAGAAAAGGAAGGAAGAGPASGGEIGSGATTG